ncbi:hypothetical protein PN498_02335 [Oscillatoria sp. CS-180]|nr:hypothetical protein [Oscillatoria sp. CS-180]MDB9524813.1 hypothetical protein [Oscillatoria sp. CS-180]
MKDNARWQAGIDMILPYPSSFSSPDANARPFLPGPTRMMQGDRLYR